MGGSTQEKIVARMNRIDALPKGVRELIHEFGYTVVNAFLDQKVTNPASIKHLILQVQRGSLDTGNGKSSQNGRVMVAIPSEPTPEMIFASMATVSGNDVIVDKYEKHKLRLRAAIKAGTSKHL